MPWTISLQDELTKAESIFNMMKQSGCFPDVITYTSIIHAHSNAGILCTNGLGDTTVFNLIFPTNYNLRTILFLGNWEKAWALFVDMEENDIQPDPILCSSMIEALNMGCQPDKVLRLAEMMKEKHISLNSSASFAIIYACSM